MHVLSEQPALMLRQLYFSSPSVVSHAFSALCAYSTLEHRPHPYATLVSNFVSVMPPIAELAHGEKLDTQSLCHSPSLFDSPGTESYRFRKSCYCYITGTYCICSKKAKGTSKIAAHHWVHYTSFNIMPQWLRHGSWRLPPLSVSLQQVSGSSMPVCWGYIVYCFCVCYPHMLIGMLWIYRLLFVCFFVCVCPQDFL